MRGLRVAHDAADVPLAVEYIVVVGIPGAARSTFRGAFEREGGGVGHAITLVQERRTRVLPRE